MPKAIEADWELIKARYITGSSSSQVAAEFGLSVGAIQKRAMRGGWTRLRTGVKDNVSGLVKQAVEMTLAEKSAKVRDGLADELMRQVETVQTLPVKGGLRALSERAELAQRMAASSAKVFGWEPGINLNLAVVTGSLADLGDLDDGEQSHQVASVAAPLALAGVQSAEGVSG
ncbi:MAG: hypothetical protein HYY24_22110 [Verrucomicrobia bacterium]|nr:hypothetical protein [Verrucomicrobiota bacterium]